MPPAPLTTQLRAVLAARVPPNLGHLRWNPGRRVVVAIAIVGLCATAFAVALYVRGRPHEVAVTAPPVAVPSLSPLATVMPSAAGDVLVVDVEGKVARPGVVRVPTGSRVIDALTAAGGALPGANTTSLDLARPLVDGEQLRVDLPGVAVGPAAVITAVPPSASGTSESGGSRVNLNTATIAALDVLPGVGPVTAQHILDWRAQHGRFASVAQLQEVSGIGPATYARLAPLVTV